MNPAESPQASAATLSRDDLTSAMFANLVIQQTNMALMFLGKAPHPDTGEPMQEMDSAQLLIDQLEMLEVKTKGNLNKNEDRLLKQSLMSLRMAFVEAVDNPLQPRASAKSQAPAESGTPSQPPDSPAATPPPVEEDSRKKFTKRY